MPLLHSSPHEGKSERFAGGGHLTTGRERVARVDHHVGAREQALGIGRIQALGDLGHDGVRGEGGDRARGRCGLARPDVLHPVRELTLQIGELHHVVVDHRERSDPGGGQGEERRGSESARADDRDVSGVEAALSLLADAGEHRVPRRADEFFRLQHGRGGDERLHGLSVCPSGRDVAARLIVPRRMF